MDLRSDVSYTLMLEVYSIAGNSTAPNVNFSEYNNIVIMTGLVLLAFSPIDIQQPFSKCLKSGGAEVMVVTHYHTMHYNIII